MEGNRQLDTNARKANVNIAPLSVSVVALILSIINGEKPKLPEPAKSTPNYS
jgi:hypothetical protein